jgi:hypothetical protein
MNIEEFALKALRKVVGKRSVYKHLPLDYTQQAAADLIFNYLSSDKPCMIARFGCTELWAVINYIGLANGKNRFDKYLRFIRGENVFFEWNEGERRSMQNLSGFFPPDDEHLNRFSQLMLECMPNIDILASWLEHEVLFIDLIQTAKRVDLMDLEPYSAPNPWSRILKGKNVLVVHPFADSIRKQYERREKLFQNPDVLPEFNLLTVKAVQSIASNPVEYADWFAALESMQEQIAQLDFDVAIIGCGAYGMPLASFVKNIGKKAIHIGGATQLLFGITGKRWDTREHITQIINEYWVRPDINETPLRSEIIEDGCYW